MRKIPYFLSHLFICSSLCNQPLFAENFQPCKNNASNFSYELSKQADSSQKPNSNWGEDRNLFILNPALKRCLGNENWQHKRILAAAAYWIQRKLNYCHHHVPGWQTPPNRRNASKHQGGYCSPAINVSPDSKYYGEKIRWNYSGNNGETVQNWQNNTMWYGMDCSNFTTFLYNFAFGKIFTSKTNYQAGQRAGHSQIHLSPNQQTATNVFDNPHAAGVLVCSDNTLETNHSCNGHGGYFSVFSSDGIKDPSRITNIMLTSLKPGDLLFIAPARGSSPAVVTHVIMWTGKKIGLHKNDIKPSQIAPNKTCGVSRKPQMDAWVIVDSHYQGPDYREFTPCFYLNNVWGVRRIIVSTQT